jgi:GNAT superfamily N-acetyltransferase
MGSRICASYVGCMTSSAPTIRPLQEADRAAWEPLWAGYLKFYRHTLDATITDVTFQRLCERADGMAGLVAVDDAGALLGFAHVIEHRSTWSATSYLYLEDLFVDPELRGGGVGRALIAAVYEEADVRGAERTYWVTEEYNWVARRTYETVAKRLSYVMYER